MNDKFKKHIISLLKHKSLLMLAPSFPIDFPYPNIIGMAKRIGFSKVTELTFGARMVNYQYIEYIKNNPNQKYYITSPCPNIVNLIKIKYPGLKKYLIPVVSPMVSMARIFKHQFPNYKIVFASPCFAKRDFEAVKFNKLINMVITFSELRKIFDEMGVYESDYNRDYQFDSFIREYTKIYPVSGGLAETSHIQEYFNKKDILVADSLPTISAELDKIISGKSKYRFFDLLNCTGGCIGGPAIFNKDFSVEHKKKLIEDYMGLSSRKDLNSHKGKIEHAKNVDFSVVF